MKRIALHIGVSCAVALLFANLLGVWAVKVIAVSAGILLAISLLFKHIRAALVLPVVLGSVLFSCLVFIFVWNTSVEPVLALDGRREYCEFQITDEPENTGAMYAYDVKIKRMSGENAVENFKAKLYSSVYFDAEAYDYVCTYLTFEKDEEKVFGFYNNFSSNIYILAHTDFFECEYTVKRLNEFSLGRQISKLRNEIRNNTAYLTNGDEGGFALALLTGDTDNISLKAKENFKICGVYHVMAVSGLNVSLICMGIYYLLKRIGVPPPCNVGVTIAVLLLYLAVSDFEQSVIRSGIMMSILLISTLFKSKSDMLNSLGAAMAVMCLNPFVVTDPSAVLTVCAVLGIALVYPKLSQKINTKSAFVNYIADGICLTGSVMMTTLAANIIFFSNVSLAGFLTNIIVVPLTELTLVFSLIFNLLCLLSVNASLFSFILVKLSGAVINTVDFCAEHMSALYVDMSQPCYFIAVGICLLLCAFYIFAFKKINVRQLCIFTAAVFALSGVLSEYTGRDEIIVDVSENSCICAYSDDAIVIIDCDDTPDYYTVRDILAGEHFKKTVMINCDYDKMLLSRLVGDNAIKYQTSALHGTINICSGFDVVIGDECELLIYGKGIEIYDDFVLVENYKAYRNVYDKFNDNKNYIFTFSNGADTEVRREKSGVY